MADSKKIHRFGRWLTLGANVGVVLGLVLLIVEVRQNASLTRTAMELQKNDALALIELSFTPETYLDASRIKTSPAAPAEGGEQ